MAVDKLPLPPQDPFFAFRLRAIVSTGKTLVTADTVYASDMVFVSLRLEYTSFLHLQTVTEAFEEIELGSHSLLGHDGRFVVTT